MAKEVINKNVNEEIRLQSIFRYLNMKTTGNV